MEMRTVYILEKWVTPEELQNTIDTFKKAVDVMVDGKPDLLDSLTETWVALKKRQQETPEGYWMGVEGKVIRAEFDTRVKKYEQEHPDDELRKVLAEVPLYATYWNGYQIIRVMGWED